MLAILFITLSFVIGFLFRKIFRLADAAYNLLRKKAYILEELPQDLVFSAIDLVSGLYIYSSVNYFLSLILKQIFNVDNLYLCLMSSLVLILSCLLFSQHILNKSDKNGKEGKAQQILKLDETSNTAKKLNSFHLLVIFISQIFTLTWSIFLTQYSFHFSDNAFQAGYTVFSDLAPHTALVSNFAKGNIPASYPHFAQAGMNYHFFFYYLAGILNALGLRLDFALNFCSALGIYTFMTLLTFISVGLSNKISSWPLTQILFSFRSSWSGFYILMDAIKSTKDFGKSFKLLREAQSYAGPLPRDEWGLYNLNVYANQRHLLFALSISLWILINFLPLLADKKDDTFNNPDEENLSSLQWSSCLALAVFCLPFAYWHGSVAISLDLILIVWAIFSRAKIKYLSFGLSTVIGAFIMLKIFTKAAVGTNHSTLISKNLFHWGYYLEDKSLASILNFLWILYGIAAVLMLVAIFTQRTFTRRIITISLLLPIIFAFTISLTPDVTVNHKYLMISQILFIPFIADLLLRLWDFGKDFSFNIPSKILTIILIIVLTFTGFTDFFVYKNANKYTVNAKVNDDFSNWLNKHTEVNSVNLTPPWHYHSYFLSGRQAHYGWSYYSSSAGYASEIRNKEIQEILAPNLDSYDKIIAYVKQYNLQYLMIDDFWRSMGEYYINEALLSEWFELIAEFPEYGNLKIYKLS